MSEVDRSGSAEVGRGGPGPLAPLSRGMSRVLRALIHGYQAWLSPLRPPSCRFYPSCSAYAVTAIERHGPARGSWLALRRLGRCHPWTAGGVDHVPPLPGHAPDDHRLPEDRGQHTDTPESGTMSASQTSVPVAASAPTSLRHA